MLRLVAVPIAGGLIALCAVSFAGVAGIGEPLASSLPADLAEAARQRLAAEPLDARSYYALAVAAESADDPAAAERLMTRALALSPRMRPARLWLLQQSALAGDIQAVIGQAQVLARLSPSAVQPISEILAPLATEPAHRAQIATRLAHQPIILATAARAAEIGLGAPAVLELLEPTDVTRLPGGLETAQSAVVTPLLAAGRPAEARHAWYTLGRRSPGTAIFDGEFRGLAGAPPFAWILRNGANLETALRPDRGPGKAGALEVTSFSSLALTAAEQRLTLEPGAYRLRFAAKVEDPAAGDGSFAWTLECGPRARLAETKIEATVADWAEQEVTFDVPEGCPLQTLRLVKLGTPDNRPRTILVSRISAEPI